MPRFSIAGHRAAPGLAVLAMLVPFGSGCGQVPTAPLPPAAVPATVVTAAPVAPVAAAPVAAAPIAAAPVVTAADAAADVVAAPVVIAAPVAAAPVVTVADAAADVADAAAVVVVADDPSVLAELSNGLPTVGGGAQATARAQRALTPAPSTDPLAFVAAP